MRTYAGVIPIPQDDTAGAMLFFGIALIIFGIMIAIVAVFFNRRNK